MHGAARSHLAHALITQLMRHVVHGRRLVLVAAVLT